MSRAIDFGRTADDYRRFRAGFPSKFFETLSQRGWAQAGQSAVDLGTGTGTVARGLAGLGLKVTGIDPAEPLLEQARALDRESEVSVSYRNGRAEATGLPAAKFDLVAAGQCWHWFDGDQAAAEANRLLRPGGRVVIAHFDWLPLAGNVVAATESLILKHNPAWHLAGGTGLYPRWLADLANAGFAGIETFSFDLDQPYSHEAWRGRIRASAGVKASLNEAGVAAFDVELAALLARNYQADPLEVPHRVWAVSAVKPESGGKSAAA